MHPLRRVTLPQTKEVIKHLVPPQVLQKNNRIALEEGNAVFDFANSPGFAILLRDVKLKKEELFATWTKAPNKEQAEVARIKAQVWDQVIEMCGRYLQDRENAEKSIRNKTKSKDLNPQGDVTPEQG